MQLMLLYGFFRLLLVSIDHICFVVVLQIFRRLARTTGDPGIWHLGVFVDHIVKELGQAVSRVKEHVRFLNESSLQELDPNRQRSAGRIQRNFCFSFVSCTLLWEKLFPHDKYANASTHSSVFLVYQGPLAAVTI